MELRAGDANAVVDLQHGGRLRSLVVGGHELLRSDPEGREPTSWGSFPMAPFAGRVEGGGFTFAGRGHQLPHNLPPHAIHGTAFLREWSPDGSGGLTVDLGPDWPFAGRAVQRFDLHPDRLELRLEVHATDGPMPASCGWHPWFRRRLGEAEASIDLDAGAMWESAEKGIPTGRLVEPGPPPWDNCFTDLARPPRIVWPGVLTLTIESSCEHYVVFTEPEDAVCVEPQTHPPDALNLEPAVVEPGRPLVAEATFRWS